MKRILVAIFVLIPIFCVFCLRASAKVPVEHFTWDDEYCAFQAFTRTLYDQQHPRQVWSPQIYGRVIGSVGTGDAIQVVIREGEHILGKGRYTLRSTVPYGRDYPSQTIEDWLIKDVTIDHAGTFFFEFTLKGYLTDEETRLRPYKVKVIETFALHGGYDPEKTFAVVAEDMLLASTIRVENKEVWNQSNVSFRFWASTGGSYEGKFPNGTCRCSVNGSRLAFEPKATINTDSPSLIVEAERWQQDHSESKSYSWRPFTVHINVFHRAKGVKSPSSLRDSPGKLNIADYPGKWECQLESNGEPIRAFSFWINEEGRLKPHPEIIKGDLNFAPGTTLVDTYFPSEKTDVSFPAETLQQGGFWGRPWTKTMNEVLTKLPPTHGTSVPSWLHQPAPNPSRKAGQGRRRSS